MPDVQRYADAVIAMIREDVATGLLPAAVASFSGMHDHVDANQYVHDAGVPWGDDDGTYNTANAVTEEVDRHLAAGEHRRPDGGKAP